MKKDSIEYNSLIEKLQFILNKYPNGTPKDTYPILPLEEDTPEFIEAYRLLQFAANSMRTIHPLIPECNLKKSITYKLQKWEEDEDMMPLNDILGILGATLELLNVEKPI